MSGTLRIQWTIAAAVPPQPLLHCTRCNSARQFESSGKFRLNANGKRLDAWLVYRCSTCGDNWNRPIFERKRRSEIDQATLDALHSNDAELARRIGFDLAGLWRWNARVEETGDAVISKRVLNCPVGQVASLEISIGIPAVRSSLRADRQLSAGLGLSRRRIARLALDGRLSIAGGGTRALARTLPGGALILLDLAGLADGAAIADAAAGRSPCADPTGLTGVDPRR